MKVNGGVDRHSEPRRFVVDEWLVAPDEGTVTRGGDVRRLEPRVMEVLAYLASRPGEVVTREELEKDVWRGALVGYDAVTGSIIKLRKALDDDARQARVIATIPKKGYKLVAPVSTPAANQTADELDENSAVRDPTGSGLRYWTLSAAAALVIVSGLFWLAASIVDDPDATGLAGGAAQPSIVVLPFHHMGEDLKEDILADGITEDIVTDLTRLSNIRVVDRNEVDAMPSIATDIGKELGVQFVLKGSVRRSGEAIRVNAQLIDAESGINVWADRYDRNVTEIFSVQDDITHHIVESLSVKVTRQEQQRIARRATNSLDAYDLFYDGQRLFKIRTRSANEQAEHQYRKAIEIDPGYGRAYGALAVALMTAHREGWVDSPTMTRERALELALKAVELDDSTPQTYWALGFTHLYRKELDKAEEVTARALNVAPNYADAYALLALIKSYRGRPGEALGLMDDAIRLNPYHPAEYLIVYGIAYYALGRYDSAIPVLEAAQQRNENYMLCKLWLAASYVRANRQDDAEWTVVEILVLNSTITLTNLEQTLPVSDSELRRTLLNDLRTAGLPW